MMTPEFKEELIEFLRENLQLDVETKSNYTGGMDGGPLYADSHTLRLTLCGEVLTETYL